jgi:hypothetical protein
MDAQIVFLELDPRSAFDRIRDRSHGRSRLDRLSEADLQDCLAETSQLPFRIVDAAGLAGLKVETLDASLAIETNAGRLGALIKGIGKSNANRG